MKTYLDCIPCFFRQIIEGTRILGLSQQKQKLIINEIAAKIPEISFESSPPESARIGYAILKRASPNKDPYKFIKQKSNKLALSFFNKLKKKIYLSKEPLLTAVELAIAGNIIDFGAKNNLNVHEELKKIIAQEKESEKNKSLFHYAEFKRFLKKAKVLLYLADNAGEVVFDRLLIEEIKKVYPEKEIIFAVKAQPVINDALEEDAMECGINKSAKIINNGTDIPGTVLRFCSKEFKKIFNMADMVISKGQGNFESLSGQKRPIFFLFKVKCAVVARSSGCKIGSTVLFYKK